MKKMLCLKEKGKAMLLISLMISMITSSIACSHTCGFECKRPNQDQKDNWKELRMDPYYWDATEWISEILEEDCFPNEAEKARQR